MRELIIFLLIGLFLVNCNTQPVKAKPILKKTYQQIIDTSITKKKINDTNIVGTVKNIRIKKESPYEMMHNEFIGSPKTEYIKLLIDEVVEDYNLPNNESYIYNLGKTLVMMRQINKGITEIEILRHVILFGSTKVSFSEQVAKSCVTLSIERMNKK
jgi:hypothetical protein